MTKQEIKFRQAMFEEDGGFRNFHFWGFIGGCFTKPNTVHCSIDEANANSAQFTGLKDRVGREIYVDDIILQNGTGTAVRWIEYKAPNFYAIRKQDGILLSFISTNVEVIGNVHENPELFEGRR